MQLDTSVFVYWYNILSPCPISFTCPLSTVSLSHSWTGKCVFFAAAFTWSIRLLSIYSIFTYSQFIFAYVPSNKFNKFYSSLYMNEFDTHQRNEYVKLSMREVIYCCYVYLFIYFILVSLDPSASAIYMHMQYHTLHDFFMVYCRRFVFSEFVFCLSIVYVCYINTSLLLSFPIR